MYVSNEKSTPFSAYSLLSSPNNKQTVFISSHGSPCRIKIGRMYRKESLHFTNVFHVSLLVRHLLILIIKCKSYHFWILHKLSFENSIQPLCKVSCKPRYVKTKLHHRIGWNLNTHRLKYSIITTFLAIVFPILLLEIFFVIFEFFKRWAVK